MNVYDFDDTIYRGDSTVDFIKYNLMKKPKVWLSVPRQLVYGFLYVLRLVPKKVFKENVFSSFKYIDSMEQHLEQFVDDHMCNIKPFYYKQQKEDDCVISASPSFLVEAFCRRLNIGSVLASPVSMMDGTYHGENCWGDEKVRRYDEQYQRSDIDEFYSDSLSDTPLAMIAKTAYLVKGDVISPWLEN